MMGLFLFSLHPVQYCYDVDKQDQTEVHITMRTGYVVRQLHKAIISKQQDVASHGIHGIC